MQYGMWYDMWCGMQYGMRCGMQCSVRYGMIWYAILYSEWYGVVWYGMRYGTCDFSRDALKIVEMFFQGVVFSTISSVFKKVV